ncbi:hypothetical protein ACFVSU_10665 [Microbacterium sp. NPDC058062]|uniref:hypothetical protein n=1 Tax=Microbacterium sp. NPDC058062 TaxID=3346320 RepID=UPI0036D90078
MSVEADKLTPDEHADMRADVLTGIDQIQHSRKRRARALAASFAVVLVAGLTAGTATLLASRTVMVPQPASSSAPTAAVETPQPCLAYEGSNIEYANGGAAIAEAISNVTLPPGFVVSPGITITSATDGTSVDAVARVCGASLSRAAMVDAGNAIAKQISSQPAVGELRILTIEPWIPVSSEAIARDENTPDIQTRYSEYDWNTPEALPDEAWR